MRLLLPNCPRSVKASARLRGTQSVRRESAEDCKGYRAGSRAGTSNAEGGKKRIEQLASPQTPQGLRRGMPATPNKRTATIPKSREHKQSTGGRG